MDSARNWAARECDVTDYLTPDMYLDIARIAEAGKMRAIFLAKWARPNAGFGGK